MLKIKREKSIILQLISSTINNYYNQIYKIVVAGPNESVKSIIAGIAEGYEYQIELPKEKEEVWIEKENEQKAIMKRWKVGNYYIGLYYHPGIMQNIVRKGDNNKLYNLLKAKKIPVSIKWIPQLWDYFITEEFLRPIVFYEHERDIIKNRYYKLNLNSLAQLEDFFVANIDWLEKKAREELTELEAIGLKKAI